jgi:hypothetical protein
MAKSPASTLSAVMKPRTFTVVLGSTSPLMAIIGYNITATLLKKSIIMRNIINWCLKTLFEGSMARKRYIERRQNAREVDDAVIVIIRSEKRSWPSNDEI